MARDPQKSLKEWTKQNWMTSATYANKKKGKKKEVKSEGKKRYLPEKAWGSLSAEEKAKTNKAKEEGNKKGKQFTKQPKSIAMKVKKFRKGMEMGGQMGSGSLPTMLASKGLGSPLLGTKKKSKSVKVKKKSLKTKK